MKLDHIDHKILRHLQENARITNAELAERVGLSPTPCLRRLRRLEDKTLREFEAAIKTRPEVMECYLVTGKFDYFIRVIVPSLAAYETFLSETVLRMPNIATVEWSFTLREVERKVVMPLPEPPRRG